MQITTEKEQIYFRILTREPKSVSASRELYGEKEGASKEKEDARKRFT